MDTQRKQREDPLEDSKLQAWRLIDQRVTQFPGEFWGLVYDLKPAVRASTKDITCVQAILKENGIPSNICGHLIMRDDLILRRLAQESAAAEECDFKSSTDLDRFKEKCIVYQEINNDQSGVFSKQLGFVLGFPLSAIRGFCRYKKVVHPTEESYVAPTVFCCSEVEWRKYEELLLAKNSQLVQLASKIRKPYKDLVAKIEPDSAITQPRIDPKLLFEEQKALKENFLNDQQSSLVQFYRLLGYNDQDAGFLACGRLVELMDLSGLYPVFTFMTWNYPDETYGMSAVDCLDLQDRVGKRRVYD